MTVNLIVLDENIAVGFKSAAGGWNTGIVPLSGGLESRNQNWVAPRRRYDFSFQGKTQTQLRTLMAFVDDRRGALHPWLLKDFLNYQLTDEVILVAVGGETLVQIIQTWGPDNAYSRNIGNIKSGTITVKKNGVTLSLGNSPADYVYSSTGLILFSVPLSAADIIAVTCQYYIKVRFEMDAMFPSVDNYNPNDGFIGAMSVTAIELLS